MPSEYLPLAGEPMLLELQPVRITCIHTCQHPTCRSRCLVLWQHGLAVLQESFKHNYSSKGQSAVIAGVRVALVLIIALVAAGVPGFGLFIALIGSLACASLSFIVPALCHLILFKSDLNWYVCVL